MRNLLLAGAAIALAVPAIALAQATEDLRPPVYAGDIVQDDRDDDDEFYLDGPRDDRDLGGAPLLDPRETAEMAQRMDRLVGAVMDLPIGPIIAAVDPQGRGEYGPRTTVRDMATRDDPAAEARIRGGIHASTAGIGALSAALAQMMPVFRQSVEQIERSLDAAMGPYRRD